jgi:hypothetical protein
MVTLGVIGLIGLGAALFLPGRLAPVAQPGNPTKQSEA